MHHVVSVNLAGVGYSTYAGDPETGLELQSLGVVTERVSSSILDAQHRLDDHVRQHAPFRSLRIVSPAEGRVAVCFGCFFPDARDRLGREGLVLLHALEISDVAALPRAVLAVLHALTPAGVQRLGEEVGRIAVEEGAGTSFLSDWCRSFEERIKLSTINDPGPSLGAPGRIVHDIAGGSTVAWLAFALAQVGSAGQWIVADAVVEGQMATVVDPPREGVVMASTLVFDGLAQALSNTAATRSEQGNRFVTPVAERTVANFVIPDLSAEPPAPRVESSRREKSEARPLAYRGAGRATLAGALGLLVGAVASGILFGYLRADSPRAPPVASLAPATSPDDHVRNAAGVQHEHPSSSTVAPDGGGQPLPGSSPTEATSQSGPPARPVARVVRRNEPALPRPRSIDGSSTRGRSPDARPDPRHPEPPPVE
jgi:hypothetical protein